MVTTALCLLSAFGTRQYPSFLVSASVPAPSKQIPIHKSQVNEPSATGESCLFDFERGEVPNCVLKAATGELSIAPQYLKGLTFDSHGLAAVRAATEGWIYVNRKGRVVVSGVPVMDNWADEFHDGLVRFVHDKKYGFANRLGRIVIPPVYDGAMNFEKGNAEVCKGCQDKCAEPACEHHFFSGGDWFLINIKGAVLKQIHPDN